MIGASNGTRSGGSFNASRMAMACSTSTPKLPVMTSTGSAAQKSTVRSAQPSSTNQSIKAWTVPSTQFVIHQLIRAGTNEGWTSAR